MCDTISISSLQELCKLPIDDPIGTIASLSCLSLSLTAVASSLRVFGSERVVFWRESSAGTNTLAYFLGKGTIAKCAQIDNLSPHFMFRFISSSKHGNCSINFPHIVLFIGYAALSIHIIVREA